MSGTGSGNSPFAAVDSDVSPALLPLATQQSVTVSASVGGISGWTTGDYKVSAQAADHADPGGGQWLLCDGTAIDAAYAALIALVGATRPDARGRTLVMKGTNAAVSTLLANDGVAVANRRPQHRHTPHSHTVTGQFLNPYQSAPGDTLLRNSSSQTTSSVDGGSGNANDSLDAPAFIVPGNLFIHT